MNYFLHFTDNFESPSQEITEVDARLLLKDHYPKREAQEMMWERLQRGEKVYVRAG